MAKTKQIDDDTMTPELKKAITRCVAIVKKAGKHFADYRAARDRAIRAMYTEFLPYMDSSGMFLPDSGMLEAMGKQGFVAATGPKPETCWNYVVRACYFPDSARKTLSGSERATCSMYGTWLEATQFFGLPDPVALLRQSANLLEESPIAIDEVIDTVKVEWHRAVLRDIIVDPETGQQADYKSFLRNYRMMRDQGRLAGPPTGSYEDGFEVGKGEGYDEALERNERQEPFGDTSNKRLKHWFEHFHAAAVAEKSYDPYPLWPSDEFKRGWFDGWRTGYNETARIVVTSVEVPEAVDVPEPDQSQAAKLPATGALNEATRSLRSADSVAEVSAEVRDEPEPVAGESTVAPPDTQDVAEDVAAEVVPPVAPRVAEPVAAEVTLDQEPERYEMIRCYVPVAQKVGIVDARHLPNDTPSKANAKVWMDGTMVFIVIA